MMYDAEMGPCSPRVVLALPITGWGSHTTRDGIDPEDRCFRPRFVGVVGYGRICDSGMGPYSPRVALDHAGCMRGVVPVRYQPSRKKQQPLAWIL